MNLTRPRVRFVLLISLMLCAIATIALTASDHLVSWVAPGRVEAVQQGEDLTALSISATVARQLESLHGGLGMMADDVMAAAYANLLLRGLVAVLPAVASI